MARRFAPVIMADLNGPVLQEAVESVTRAGGRARSVTLDVTDFAQVKRMADDAVAEHGRLDYVFNNAGIGILGEVQNFSYEDWRRVIDANLYGVVNGVAAVYPIMVKQGFGHIINTARRFMQRCPKPWNVGNAPGRSYAVWSGIERSSS